MSTNDRQQCALCGSQPARKANIGGRAEWRCATHEHAARIAAQHDIDEAIAKGATWLGKRAEGELVQRDLFELWEGA